MHHQFYQKNHSYNSVDTDIILYLSQYIGINITKKMIDDIVITYALQQKKSLQAVTVQEFQTCFSFHFKVALHDLQLLPEVWYVNLLQGVYNRLRGKIDNGRTQIVDKVILHTAPHHDDIILGYHGYVEQLLEHNQNHILYMTSGYRGVVDTFVIDRMHDVFLSIQEFTQDRVWDTSFYDQALGLFGKSFSVHDKYGMDKARQMIMLYIVAQVFEYQAFEEIYVFFKMVHEKNTLDFCDTDFINRVKEMLRESESDCKWRCFVNMPSQIIHARLHSYAHYRHDAVNHDVQVLLRLLRSIQPDIITLAQDPCGVGPATHFLTSDIMMQALRLYQQEGNNKPITILGYRNVWGAFTLAQASKIIFLDDQALDKMGKMFAACFASQKNPAVPSYLFEGSFADIVELFLDQQGADVQMLLGLQDQHKRYALYLHEYIFEE